MTITDQCCSEQVAHPSTPDTPVWFAGHVAAAAARVESAVAGRYRCHPDAVNDPGIIVTDPTLVVTFAVLRRQHPHAELVVWDRRDTAPSEEVAAAFTAGADAYVAGPSIALLVAHLDALRRTRRLR